MSKNKIIVMGNPGLYHTLEEVLGEEKQYIRAIDVCLLKKNNQYFIAIDKESPTTKTKTRGFDIELWKVKNVISINLRDVKLIQKKTEMPLEELKKKYFLSKIPIGRLTSEERISGF